MRRPTPRRPPVDMARNVIQGASGGIVAGALIGLAEATTLLVVTGAPDLVSPFYAVVLYGLVGLPFGVGAGLALTGWEKLTQTVSESAAWAFGFAAATAPFLLVVLYTLGVQLVYPEREMPLNGQLAVAGLSLGIAVLGLLLWPFVLHGRAKVLLKAKGLLFAWGGLMFVTGAIAEAPLQPDPRDGWGSGRPVPGGLADAPNVLVILVDALRPDQLGCFGAEGNPTPVMDALAADGIVFEHAFAQSSLPRSSAASLLASRLPSDRPGSGVTWPEVLRTAGVSTGALVGDTVLSSVAGLDRGFETFYREVPEYRFRATESVFGLTLYRLLHGVSERLLGRSRRVERYYQPADVVLADARRFVEANRDSRWALLVHLMEPRDPYFAHPSVDGSGLAHYDGVSLGRGDVGAGVDAKRLRRAYRDEVVFLDRQLAPFVEWMRASGVYDDTLVVLTSDHGTELGEHGGFWYGETLYDEQIHVPLVVRLPANRNAGARAPWQVRLLDVGPTLTAALGLDAHPTWAGRDLLAEVAPVAPGDSGEAEPDPGVEEPGEGPDGTSTQEPEPVREPEPVQEPEPVAHPRSHPLDRVAIAEARFEGNALSAIRGAGFKYMRANEGNPRGLPSEALFDLVADPGETANLLGTSAMVAGKSAEKVADTLAEELRQALAGDDETTGEGTQESP